jgi:3-dehydroquinate synthase II/3-amino-4-hydroxybenzoic acid synthase
MASISNSLPTYLDHNILKLPRQGNRGKDVHHTENSALWYQLSNLPSGSNIPGMLLRLRHSGYTGVVLTLAEYSRFRSEIPESLLAVVNVESAEELAGLSKADKVVVKASNNQLLHQAKLAGFATCFRQYVIDAKTLDDAVVLGRQHKYLLIGFKDPTNIPLELVIASLQASHTVLIKEIVAGDVDDAIASLGVMEVGADGVMYSPSESAELEDFIGRLSRRRASALVIESATITRSVPIGMGYRSCLDLTTLFEPTEGMLIGSTSQGGILCCPEVFFLPYMELRPFRVNAGAVHSYHFNAHNTTRYLTELRAGSQVLVTDINGTTRVASIGRIKTEVRPLRLIEATFASGETINTIMQDDWHVRIFSDAGGPLNITTLKPGDKIAGLRTEPGRHVGIKINENIIEN